MLKQKRIIFATVFVILVTNNFVVRGAFKKDPKPNIIIIYTDDLGYGDISANGAAKISTPNIDRIAKEGLRFTNAYAIHNGTVMPVRKLHFQ